MRSVGSYFVSTLDADLEELTGLDEMHVHEGLRQLVGFVRVDDLDLYLSGDVELSLEPLLNGGDGALAKRLDTFWRTSYVRRRIEAVSEAEDAIDVHLAQTEARATVSARERLTVLQARWARFAANRRFKTPLDVQEIADHLPEFELEVAELEAIHDGLTGLLARPDECTMLFAERHPVSTGSRLQAMRARPRVIQERPAVSGRDRLVVVK